MPTTEELKESELYFIELEDALRHYSKSFPGRLFTFTIRTNEQGKPAPTMMSGTSFPCLDDMPEHLDNLAYAAQRLDLLPTGFWGEIYPNGVGIPVYIPMQIVLWGIGNKDRSVFTKQAELYKDGLKKFSWAHSDHPDTYRDNAEQCFRMIRTYTRLHSYFSEKGLPAGSLNFD
jgi:hypothetical protein